jgi:hypothetical protein
MNAKDIFGTVRKFLVLTCLTMVCFALATFGSGLANLSMVTEPASDTASADPADAFLPTLLFSFLLTCVFGFAIIRSRLHGPNLMLSIFITFFGLIAVMTHSESIAFLRHTVSGTILLRFFLMGGIFAALFAPVSVMIMGRLKQAGNPALRQQAATGSATEWVWKLALVGVIYLIIYNIFGYFIAWKNPSLRSFYGGVDEGSLFAHLRSLWESSRWLFPFQFGRGILWALFALPVIRMFAGRRWEVGLTIALLFSVWSTQLLWPNPFIPKSVAQTHFVETSTSNLLFGFIVGMILGSRSCPQLGEAEPSVTIRNLGGTRI